MTSNDVLFLKYNIPKTSFLKLMETRTHMHVDDMCTFINTRVPIPVDMWECMLYVYIMEMKSNFS